VKSGSLKLREVSPEALANYLEAFANEGMLYWTPPEYFENEEMKTSLEVVFEFRENVVMNRHPISPACCLVWGPIQSHGRI
jgi:hypothetical protein